MNEKRKIALVVKKYGFKEAGDADDKCWSEKPSGYRFSALMGLRQMTYGEIKDKSIKKVVYKYKRNKN